MVALSLAILDRNNRPLFLQEFVDYSRDPSEEELMGLDVPVSESLECSTDLQFVMHAALDRLDQLMSTPSGGVDGMFLGLLVPVNEMSVYGYVTTTQTRIILVVEDEALPEIQKNVDEEIKRLLVNVHDLYVADLLNPFKQIGSPIVSQRFRGSIQRSVATFNQSYGI